MKLVAKLEVERHNWQPMGSVHLDMFPSRTEQVKEHPSKIWLTLSYLMPENPRLGAFSTQMCSYGVGRA